MRNPKYLLLSRNGVYYFRWPIPKALCPYRKPCTVKVSLRTRDPSEALRLARFLTCATQHDQTSGPIPSMNYSEIRAALHRHFKGLLENQRRKLDATGPLGTLDRVALENSQQIADEAAKGKGSLTLVGEDNDTLSRFIDKYRLAVQPGTPQYEWLRSEFPKSYRDYCRDALALNASLDTYDYSDKSTDTVPSSADGSGQQSAVSLKDAAADFVDQHVRAGSWQRRSEDARRAQLSLLIELLGSDRDCRTIGKPLAREVVQKLQRLPKNMRKSPAFRDKTLSEILNMDHGNGMHVSTINEYIGVYSMFFGWSVEQGLSDNNPFSGLELPAPKKSRGEGRKPFTDDQLRIIEHTLLTDLGGVKTPLSHKWASLIAMYTGARAGEVCQLHRSDIYESEGIVCININDDGDEKRVKTDASVRVVPVHSRLLELGLLDFIQTRTGRLFPDYKYSVKNGLSRNLSRWFNERLLVKLELKEPDVVLHSLRHTMDTKLNHADVPASKIKAIIGHTDDSMTTGVYFASGYKLSQLKAAIEEFRF